MVSLTTRQLKQFIEAAPRGGNAHSVSLDSQSDSTHDQLINVLTTEGAEAAFAHFDATMKQAAKTVAADTATRIKGATLRLMAIWFDTFRTQIKDVLVTPKNLFEEFSSTPNEDTLAAFMDAFVGFERDLDDLLAVDDENESNQSGVGHTHHSPHHPHHVGPMGNPFEINERLVDLYKMAIGSAINSVHSETMQSLRAVSDVCKAVADERRHEPSVVEGGGETARNNRLKNIDFASVRDHLSHVPPGHVPPQTRQVESEFHSLPRDRIEHSQLRFPHNKDDEAGVEISYPQHTDSDDLKSEYRRTYGTTQQQQHGGGISPAGSSQRDSFARKDDPVKNHRRIPEESELHSRNEPGVIEHLQNVKQKRFAVAGKVGGEPTPINTRPPTRAASATTGSRPHTNYSVAEALRHDVEHDLPIRGRAGKQYRSNDPNSIANIAPDLRRTNCHEDPHVLANNAHCVNNSTGSADTVGSSKLHPHDEKRRKAADYDAAVTKERDEYFAQLQRVGIFGVDRDAGEPTKHSHPTSLLDGGRQRQQPLHVQLAPAKQHYETSKRLNNVDVDEHSVEQQEGEASPRYQEPVHRHLPSPRITRTAEERPSGHKTEATPTAAAHRSPSIETSATTSLSRPATETSKMTQLRLEMASLKRQLSSSQAGGGGTGSSQEIQYYAIHKRMQRVRAEMIQEQRDIDAVNLMEAERQNQQKQLQAKRRQFKR